MPSIVAIVNAIRRDTPQEPGEPIDAWLKRTWTAAIAEVERQKHPLPLVEARRVRSEARLRHIFSEYGSLIEEKDEDE